jgi:hypothetical protein
MPKSKEFETHFEQVSLAIVKKIAQEDIPGNEANGAYVIVEPPARKVAVIPGYRSPTLNSLQHTSLVQRKRGLKVQPLTPRKSASRKSVLA